MVTWKECGTWTMSLLSWTVFTRMYRKGKDCNPMYLEFKDNISLYYQTEEELQRVKDDIAKKADTDFLRNKIEELRQQIQTDIDELKIINKELTEDNLAESFNKYWNLYQETVFGMAIDIYFDDIPCDKLSNFLKEKIKDKKTYNKAFALLTSPVKQTRTQQEEIEFSKTNDYKKHLNKWSFIPMWFDNDPWTIEDLKKRPKINIKNNWLEERSNMLKKLDPPAEVLELINLIAEYAYIRQEGEVQISYHNYHGKNMKSMICKKLNITLNDLKFLTDDEIIENLSSLNPNLKEIIKERQKYCFFVAKDGEYLIYTGKEAEQKASEIKSKITKKDLKLEEEIQGTVGSPGKAKGKVFIVNSLDDINRIQEGNIMVVSATSVEYISAIEKSAGIITEFGGITSHAAIISRELGKPCIIKVGNATKRFKNGETIELDAQVGVIRRSKPKA